MARQLRERQYEASDLKRLMDDTGTWAQNWDDVLRYLEGPAIEDTRSSAITFPQLVEDVRHLRNDNIPFTTDYRLVWKELTGESIDDASADESATATEAEPEKLSRVLDVLQRVESKEYKEMAELLESSRGGSWDHTR